MLSFEHLLSLFVIEFIQVKICTIRFFNNSSVEQSIYKIPGNRSPLMI